MRSTSIHSCLCAIIFSAATFSVGVAQERDPGTRLIMEQDSGKARLILEGAADEPEEPGEGVSVGVRGRYVTVPDAIFDAFLLDHTSFHSYSLGLEVGFDGPAKSRIIVGVDYTDLGMPSGNFRQDKKRPDQASFTEVDLHMIALDVTFLWKYKIIEQFGLGHNIWPYLCRVAVLALNTHLVGGDSVWHRRHQEGHFRGARIPFRGQGRGYACPRRRDEEVVVCPQGHARHSTSAPCWADGAPLQGSPRRGACS